MTPSRRSGSLASNGRRRCPPRRRTFERCIGRHLTSDGTAITIRKFPHHYRHLTEIVQTGALTSACANFLLEAVGAGSSSDDVSPPPARDAKPMVFPPSQL